MGKCLGCKKKLGFLEGYSEDGEHYCDNCWNKKTGVKPKEKLIERGNYRWCRKCGNKQLVFKEKINPSSIIGAIMAFFLGVGFFSTTTNKCSNCGANDFSKKRIATKKVKSGDKNRKENAVVSFIIFFFTGFFMLNWHWSLMLIWWGLGFSLTYAYEKGMIFK